MTFACAFRLVVRCWSRDEEDRHAASHMVEAAQGDLRFLAVAV